MDLADNDPTLFQTWLGAGNTSNTIEIRQIISSGYIVTGKQEQQEHGLKDRKSTRLNSSHRSLTRMPSSA